MYLYLTQYHQVLQSKNVVVVTQLQTLINLAAHAFNWHTWVQKKLAGIWLDQLPHIQLAFVCLRFNESKHSSFCTATEKASTNEHTSLLQTSQVMSVLCRSSASLEFCTLRLEKFPIQIILTRCERLNKWEFELDLFKVHLHSIKTLQKLRLDFYSKQVQQLNNIFAAAPIIIKEFANSKVRTWKAISNRANARAHTNHK